MLYLAWDIDGTLLLTNRAGYDALQEAICDYFFRKEPYEFKHTLAGCTDSSIIKEIVTDIKGHCTSGWAASLMLKYESQRKRAGDHEPAADRQHSQRRPGQSSGVWYCPVF